MPRRRPPIRVDLQKVTINLRDGDMDYLQRVYPIAGGSAVIRKVVATFVDNLRAEAAAKAPAPETLPDV